MKNLKRTVWLENCTEMQVDIEARTVEIAGEITESFKNSILAGVTEMFFSGDDAFIPCVVSDIGEAHEKGETVAVVSFDSPQRAEEIFRASH